MSENEPRVMVDLYVLYGDFWSNILNASPTNQQIIRSHFPDKAEDILNNSSSNFIRKKLEDNQEQIDSKIGYIFGEVEVKTVSGKRKIFILEVVLNDGSVIFPVVGEKAIKKAVINTNDFRARRF